MAPRFELTTTIDAYLGVIKGNLLSFDPPLVVLDYALMCQFYSWANTYR